MFCFSTPRSTKRKPNSGAKSCAASWIPSVEVDANNFCHSVVVLYYDTNLIKASGTFCCVFQCQTVGKGNQHGGREYDDLQN